MGTSNLEVMPYKAIGWFIILIALTAVGHSISNLMDGQHDNYFTRRSEVEGAQGQTQTITVLVVASLAVVWGIILVRRDNDD